MWKQDLNQICYLFEKLLFKCKCSFEVNWMRLLAPTHPYHHPKIKNSTIQQLEKLLPGKLMMRITTVSAVFYQQSHGRTELTVWIDMEMRARKIINIMKISNMLKTNKRINCWTYKISIINVVVIIVSIIIISYSVL